MVKTKIDYVVISNDDNPSYTGLIKPIIRRWNDLGYRVIYVEALRDPDISREYLRTDGIDQFGNMYVRAKVPPLYPKHWELWRFIDITLLRYLVSAQPQFADKVMMISDGDLYPINKKYVNCPSIELEGQMNTLINQGTLITTCMYAHGDALATYTYGKGSTFSKLLGTTSLIRALDQASAISRKFANMYMTEEFFINRLMEINKVDVHKCINRRWTAQSQEMNNLYYYQIDKLNSWTDLCPFLELHGMRTEVMTDSMWSKLESLCKKFDKYDITPPNYFYTSIKPEDRWYDTVILKTPDPTTGAMIKLGDEYTDSSPIRDKVIYK